MEILKKLLDETLNKRLNRLENRNIIQFSDLKISKLEYTKMDKNVSNIKIVPRPIKTIKTMKRDVSADNIKDKKRFERNNRPNYMKPLNKSKTINRFDIAKSAEPKKPKIKKIVTKNSAIIPSYMQNTASNLKKEKNKIHNQYYNLRVQKEKDFNSNRTTIENNRSKTPDPNFKKKSIKKNDNINNKNLKNSNFDSNNLSIKKTYFEENNTNKNDIKNSIINNQIDKIENLKENIIVIDEKKENNEKINNEIKNIEIKNNEIKKKNLNNNNNNKFENLLIENNNKMLEIICNYLDFKDKLNFFFVSKKLLPNFFNLIENFYKDFKKLNNITIYTINDKIENIKLRYSENLEKEMNFKISEGSEKAIQLLNEDYYKKSFKNKKIIENENKIEIILVYKIFFQFLKNDIVNIKNINNFWNETCEYINNNSNGRIGDFIIEKGKEFDFSAENLYKIKKLVNGNEEKMKNKYYSERDGGTGLFVFLIKDALEFCGLIENEKKSCPKIMLNYYEYVQNLNDKIVNYINKLKDKYKY